MLAKSQSFPAALYLCVIREDRAVHKNRYEFSVQEGNASFCYAMKEDKKSVLA